MIDAIITQQGWSAADLAAVISAMGSFGMLAWMVLSQVPKSRRNRDVDIVHRSRVEDIILGRPAEQGIPAVPSLTDRMDSQDKRLTAIELVTKELRPNGGSHLADKVGRIEKTVVDVQTKLVDVQAKLDDAKKRIDDVEGQDAQPPNRPDPQRNRRSPRPRPTTQGESK